MELVIKKYQGELFNFNLSQTLFDWIKLVKAEKR